jgi:hypothetical protein
MIQAFTNSNFTAYVQTLDNTINTSLDLSLIRYLYKFTNDMDKSIQYAYAVSEVKAERFTSSSFQYNSTPNVFTGRVNLKEGFYKYEVYEVSWVKGVNISAGYAPANESDVFEPNSGDYGVVNGLVTKGKMYVADNSDAASYLQNGKSLVSITIIDGGVGYTSAPTITISGGGNPITTATATCDVDGGKVTDVVITNAGNGYTEIPTVSLTGGGSTKEAQLIASIEKTNYIYLQ